MSTNTAIKPTTTSTVKAIPEGYHTITAGISLNDAKGAIEFYKKTLGATELFSMACEESGKIMHAELKVGDSIFAVSDANPAMGCTATSSSFWLYVNDCDGAYNRALAGGMTVKSPVQDMFWGDRVGSLTDPYGNRWSFATHKLDLTPAQISDGQKKFVTEMKAKMAAQGSTCTSTDSKSSTGSCSSSKKA